MPRDNLSFEKALRLLDDMKPIDHERFRAVYDLLHQPIRRRAIGLLKGPRAKRNSADDVVQEVFLRIYRWPPNCTSCAELRGWLAKTLKSAVGVAVGRERALDEATKRDLCRRRATGNGHADHPIIEMLRSLPPEQRILIHYRYWEGMSYRKIADRMQISVAAVGTRLHRAHQRLKAGWANRNGA